MANKHVSKYSEQWEKASKLVAGRVARLREQGFQVNYSINRPKNIRKEDVEWLRGLTAKKIKQGKSTKRFTIDIEQVGYDTRPSRVSPRSTNNFKSDTKEYNPPLPQTNQSKQRKRLRDLGLNDEQIDFGLSLGNSLQDLIDNAEYFEESPSEEYENTDNLQYWNDEYAVDPDTGELFPFSDENIEIPSGTTEVYEAEYYLDPETGEMFSPNDKSIYLMKKGRYVRDIHGELAIKPNLEHHVTEVTDPRTIESLKWDNFIASFNNIKASHLSGLNPADIFNKLREQVSINQITDLLNEMNDYSSNISDVSYWYKASVTDQAEKMNSFLNALDKKYGTDTSELRREINEQAESIAFLENAAGWGRNINL